MEANSTGGQGSCRAVAPSDDDDYFTMLHSLLVFIKSVTLKTGPLASFDVQAGRY